MVPETRYNLITRTKDSQPVITFQRLPEPCAPYVMNRGMPFQFMQRIREFPPDLLDIIILASTGSGDVGLVTRSRAALTSEVPADQTINVFATNTMADDSRRAQLPMTITEEMVDTSPIGVAIDLSSKDKVSRPLPKEEFDESAGALPALMILNNEGVLMTWWIVYADSIRQGTSFPGLAALGGVQSQQPPQHQRQASPFSSVGQGAAPAFGQSAFGQAAATNAAFGTATSKPAIPAFGASTAPGSTSNLTAPAFGVTNAPSGAFGATNKGSTFGAGSTPGSAFGSAPTLGKPASPWGGAANNSFAAPAFGKPSFGSSTPSGASSSGPAFGQTGGLARSSAWGTPPSGSAFGQVGSMGNKTAVFGAASTSTPIGSTVSANGFSPAAASGFASFASNPSGFLAAGTKPVQSVFGTPSSGPITGSGSGPLFGQSPNNEAASNSTFGGTSGFSLGSTFKTDGTAKSDGPRSTGSAASSTFNSNFGDALGATQTGTPQTKDADMDDDSEDDPKESSIDQPVHEDPAEVNKPASQIPQTDPPKTGGLFGTQSQGEVTPAEVGTSKPTSTWPAAKSTIHPITPKEIHVKGKDPPKIEPSPKIKEEPQDSEDEQLPASSNEKKATTTPISKPADSLDSEESLTPEAPLPPDSTSKASFAPGDSSNSSKSSNEERPEFPLPPEPLPSKSKLSKVQSASAEPPLPPDHSTPNGKPEHDRPATTGPPGLPNEDDDEGLDTEGSGVDVAQEFSSPSDQAHSPKDTPETSFSFPKSSAGGLFSQTHTQQAMPKGPPLFGEIESSSGGFGKPSAPFFPQPNKTQQSPRSPSPVRHSQLAMEALRPENARSLSAPGPLKAIADRKAAMSLLSVPPKQSQPSSIELRKQEEQRVAVEKARQAAEEEQSLSDDQDEQIRRELENPVAGSRSLDPFLAHQDYVGNIDKPGIPGQIERVYRDINSMIDTLGLNARSLTAFVRGHTEQIVDQISTDDLEHLDDFALGDISRLMDLEAQLSDDVASHRFLDVQGNLSTCRDIHKDIHSLRHKRNDMTRALVALRSKSDIAESALSVPLSLEQASQQHDLRKKFAQFQRLLAQTEEDVTMLRAKLASCEQSRPGSSAGLPVQKKPTVEAVTKTILKMTSIVEKKSGDIDMLEAQLRSLRLPSIDDGQSSREGSPFAASNGRTLGGLKGSIMDTSLRNSSAIKQSSPLRRSLNGDGSPKKGLDGLAAEEVLLYREKARRRKEVNALVRQAFEKSGPRIRTLD